MPKAVVTGASGFLGSTLLRQLLAQDWDVVGISRGSSSVEHPRYRHASADIANRSALLAACPGPVDVVFHTAADTSIWSRQADRQWRTNVLGTRNMLYAAQEAKAACVVHVSTASLYGHPSVVFDESAAMLPASHWVGYVRSKRAAEDQIRIGLQRGQDAVIVNPGHILGPGDTGGWARLLLMTQARTLPGTPPGGGCFCHVEAIADAMIAAASKGRRGQNYLLGGPYASFHDLVCRIARLQGMPLPRSATPAWLLWLASRVLGGIARITRRQPRLTPEGAWMVCHTARFSSALAQRELGYAPPDLDRCISDTNAWLEQQGHLPQGPPILNE